MKINHSFQIILSLWTARQTTSGVYAINVTTSAYHSRSSTRFLCRLTTFFSTCWSRGTLVSSTYGKQRVCPCNSAMEHFHVSCLSDFIFYPKPLYKSLHQSFFYSFITILPSESGVTLHYCITARLYLRPSHFVISLVYY
jgi:hypothetical protein